jgi:hypothetical protein
LVLEIEFQFRGAVDAQNCRFTNIDVKPADASISVVEIKKRVDLFCLREGEWREVVIRKDDWTHSHSFSCDVHEVGKTIGNENDTTIQKRQLVAAKRLSASFDKGGLQIQHPEETAEGLRLNLLQKYFRKINNNQMTIFSRIITQILLRAGRLDLTEHINSMGPREWHKTSLKIRDTNPMLSEAFQSMVNLLTKLEDSSEDWHHAPIWGHSRTHKLFPLYPADIATLQTLRINTVSQSF